MNICTKQSFIKTVSALIVALILLITEYIIHINLTMTTAYWFLLSILLGSVSTCDRIKYGSLGEGSLMNEEGVPLLFLNGADAMEDMSIDQCALSCNTLNWGCPDQEYCCDSFSYNANIGSGRCLLKRIRNEIEFINHRQGWQSFISGEDGTEFAEACGPQDVGTIADVYVTKGPKQLAVNEGEGIKTSGGWDYLNGVTPEECAEDCDLIPGCDGFAYNPYQHGGKCYMKSGSLEFAYETKINDDGWRFYWKGQDQDSMSKCMCNCQSEFSCVVCWDSPAGNTTWCDAI